jgi:hypothetical protein
MFLCTLFELFDVLHNFYFSTFYDLRNIIQYQTNHSMANAAYNSSAPIAEEEANNTELN